MHDALADEHAICTVGSQIAILMDSGLRAAEVCRLTTKQIDLTSCLLWTIVKGGQEKFGAISIETANYISAWLADRNPIAKCDRIFIGMKTGKPMTGDGLRTTLHNIGEETGIKGLSPHVLRRTFATLSTLNGATARIVQEAGRWNDLKQVQDYTAAISIEAIRPYLPISGIMRSTND
ncbi:MAG: tyrosine-type recombinase/integrase [Chloroflexi bacterium]|nr:tyrosine-type recombinase/integrase [Chloroflexota bacterium]